MNAPEKDPAPMPDQDPAARIAALEQELAELNAAFFDGRPGNVVAALAAVMRELPAIGKNQEVKGDGPSYKFRGIEDITAAAQNLLGKFGVVFVPRVVGMERRDVAVGSRGAVWDEYVVTVEYDVYGPGGPTDCLPAPVRVVQLGRDNSDKGMAKAMTMAYKTALVQVLCIGDSKNDADNEHHANADTAAAPPKPNPGVRARALAGVPRDAFVAFLDNSNISRTPKDWTHDLLVVVDAWLDVFEADGFPATTLAELADALPDESDVRGLVAGVADRQSAVDPPAENSPPDERDGSDPPDGAADPAEAESGPNREETEDSGDIGERIAATVKGMDLKDVRASLSDRGIDHAGTNADQQRKRLIVELVKDHLAGVQAE